MLLRVLWCVTAVSAAVYPIDGDAQDRQFDGIGAISGGGATSRLLVSYPKDELNDILDYLFKPGYGADLDILKVEMGGDAQSTDGSEASHMHTADEENYERGYEWWLMKEAKKRKPEIRLSTLPWAFPAWVGNGTNSPYTYPNLTATYVTKWVMGAKSVHNLTIDFVGIWNERAYDVTYIKTLRNSLDSAGFGSTKIIAADSKFAGIAKDINNDPALAKAVWGLGAHYPGTKSGPEAEATGKPLWASEDFSTYNDLSGAGCWARILNQNFINGHMTSTIAWNLIGSYYPGLNFFSQGLMSAANPWSGYYDVKPPIWATAHTTHFTEPGWHYLAVGSGSSHLSKGGSFVTMVSPDNKHFTIIIEKMSHQDSRCVRPPLPEYATEDEVAHFQLAGALAGLNVSQLSLVMSHYGLRGDADETVEFMPSGTVAVGGDGSFSLPLSVNSVYTLTTLSVPARPPTPPVPARMPFPVPYEDDFDSSALGSEAPLFADQAGVWEVVKADDSSRGNVMRQMIPTTPICWSGDLAPFSVIGAVSMRDVDVSVDVFVEEEQTTEVAEVDKAATTGRIAFVASGVGTCCTPHGIFFGLHTTSATQASHWSVATSLRAMGDQVPGTLASGAIAFSAGQWATLRLVISDNVAQGWIDGNQVFDDLALPKNTVSGWAAIGTWPYVFAQFDNFKLASASSNCVPGKAGQRAVAVACGDEATLTGMQFDLLLDTAGSRNSTLALTASSGQLCLDVVVGQAQLELAGCSPNSSSQIFVFNPETRKLVHQDTGKCVAIRLDWFLGTPVVLSTCTPLVPSQEWTYDPQQKLFRSIEDTGHYCFGVCL